MYTWSERCRSHARLFLRSGESVNERWSLIKYWSNSDGELHRYGKEDITEAQLPFMLKKAYNEAYLQVPGLYSYLVETSAGYGISYEMHLDEGYVRSFGLSMKEAFDAITKLLVVYRHKAGLRGCDIFLFEDTEWDGHEIVFVVPADVSKKRLKMVSETVIKFEEELDEILKNMKEERTMCKNAKYKLPGELQLRLIESDFGIEEEDDNTVRLIRYSPAGQDFGISVDIGENLHDLKQNLARAYENYDVSYETYIWLDNTGHGKDGAPHDMLDVYTDMQTCHEYIEKMRKIVSDYLDENPDDDDKETAAELLVPPEMH